MSQKNPNYRWFVVAIFFFFMLLHQTDKLMIGSLQVQISETFGLNDFQWGLVNSGALAVATVLYPLWGYLYDHYARSKLLALASFIWGATTWLNAIVRTYTGFLIRALRQVLTTHPTPAFTPSLQIISVPTCAVKCMAFCKLRNRLGS